MKIAKLKNPRIAYLVGVFQTDGYYYIIKTKDGKVFHKFCITGRYKSQPMVEECARIYNEEFCRNVSIYRKNGYFIFKASINTLLKVFKKLQILPKKLAVPSWILDNDECFGAYLAGLIDGDGNVCIKRKLYPQCRVRIINGDLNGLIKLSSVIEKKLKCSTTIRKKVRITSINGKAVIGKAYDLDFYVSKKNLDYFKIYVLPFIKIKHKRKVINHFCKFRYKLT